MSFAKRFIGAENLPTRLSEFDVQQSFCMSADDIAAVSGRFRHDRRVAAAIQMLFLRASGRPMDRFASVPKTLLRAVCEAFQTPAVSIASLRSLYARRQTLYEHQAWARTYLGLLDLDAAGVDQLQRFWQSPRSRPRIPTISPKPPACGCTNGASSSLGRAALQTWRARPSTPPRRPWQPRSRPASARQPPQGHRLVLCNAVRG
jgi:hypothetical protein